MIGEWFRFCVVGALSAAMNTIIIVLLTELLGLHYMLSVIACFLIVTLFGFVLNRGWSFQVKRSGWREDLIRYVMVAGTGVLLTLSLIWAMVRAGIPYYGGAYAAAIILAPYNFLAHRFFSFRLGTKT
jgi:putative flippase GtrA